MGQLTAGPMLTSMVDGDDDPLWDAFVNAMLAAGTALPVRAKPALFMRAREVADRDAPGIIDLRITRRG